MATTTTPAHLPPLGAHRRAEIGREVQATLAELVDLALVGKQLHWRVVGPHFQPSHRQLDELVDAWRDLADTVAERAVALGSWPDGQAGPIAADSALTAVERGPIEDRLVVRELARRVAEVGERIRRHPRAARGTGRRPRYETSHSANSCLLPPPSPTRQ